MTDPPLVTVVIPMVDEIEDIEACLAAVLAQDHPADRLEVLVVDGGSTDRSSERATQVLAGSDVHAWRVLHNPARTTPSSLNLGLAEASGEILCRVDARTIVQRDHVTRCVTGLGADPAIAVIGGSQVAIARGRDAHSRGIARALNNRLSMGGADYRSGRASGPTDTVYLGAFRTDDLRAAGGWDERFPTNQDFELNRRMGRQGVVWLDADIRSGYVPRAHLRGLWQQYHRFGRWKVRYWRTAGEGPVPRQRLILALPLVPLALVATVALLRPAGLLPLAAVGVGGLLVVDAVGADGPAPPAVRAWASVATLVVSTAWWVGVVHEVVRPSR